MIEARHNPTPRHETVHPCPKPPPDRARRTQRLGTKLSQARTETPPLDAIGRDEGLARNLARRQLARQCHLRREPLAVSKTEKVPPVSLRHRLAREQGVPGPRALPNPVQLEWSPAPLPGTAPTPDRVCPRADE